MRFGGMGAFAPVLALGLFLAGMEGASADLSISHDSTVNVSCSDGVCTATAKRAVLNVNDLTAMLASGDTKVVTGGGADDILVEAPLGWSSASVLTFDSMRSITVDRAITVKGPGGLGFVTNDGGVNGRLSFGVTGRVSFEGRGGSLTINQQSYALAANISKLARLIAANPNGGYALADNYDAGKDGSYGSSPISTRFNGALEGLGNTISNLTINDNSDANVGLFADIGNSGTVSDIRLINANVSADTTQATLSIGPLAGLNEGIVAAATSAGSVSGNGGNYPDAGGLVGTNTGTIAYSHSAANVTDGDSGVAGGLVGYVEAGHVYASSAAGTVSAGQGCQIGGFVGSNDGQIEQSYSVGAVSAEPESKSGGFVGYDSGPISDSYSTGNAAQASSLGYSGGFVGFFQPSGTSLLTRNYSTGAPSGGNFDGGFVGFDESSGINLAFNYWDRTTSRISDPSGGAGNEANDPGIKGLTSRQLRARLPHEFHRATWARASTINQGFPYLRANPPPK